MLEIEKRLYPRVSVDLRNLYGDAEVSYVSSAIKFVVCLVPELSGLLRVLFCISLKLYFSLELDFNTLVR